VSIKLSSYSVFRRYKSNYPLYFLLISDVSHSFKLLNCYFSWLVADTFSQKWLEWKEKSFYQLAFNFLYWRGLISYRLNEYLWDGTPKSTELLIANIGIRVDINDFVYIVYFLFGVRISLISIDIINPKRWKSEIRLSRRQDIKQFMACNLIICLV
jgi:hypothetical protein